MWTIRWFHVLLLLCCSRYLFCEPQSPPTWKGRMPCCIYTTEGRCPGKSVWQRVNTPKAVSPQCWAEHSRPLSLCFLQTHLAIPAFLCKIHHSNWSLWSFPGLSKCTLCLTLLSPAHILFISLFHLCPLKSCAHGRTRPLLSIMTPLIVLTRAAAFTWQDL